MSERGTAARSSTGTETQPFALAADEVVGRGRL